MDVFKYEAHSPKKRKHVAWSVCSKCGLIYLNNDFTRFSIKNGCNSNDHPGYAKARENSGRWR